MMSITSHSIFLAGENQGKKATRAASLLAGKAVKKRQARRAWRLVLRKKP
ncbi:hypothetical protein ACOZWC_000420 [Cronobacter turicensis]|nr:hypothetical protein [Cronobacter turicensis]